MEKRISRDKDYIIDDMGNVYSVKGGVKRRLKQTYKKTRGNIVYLGKAGVSVQLLMAETFLEKPKECDMVKHKNGINTDNRLENIYWTSQIKEYEKRIQAVLNVLPKSNEYEKRINEIDGYSDIIGYTVTKDGKVYSFLNGERKLQKVSLNNGYPQVAIGSRQARRVTRKVHRLVAEAFINKIDGKDQINHIDGNKSNNSVENLEWVNNSENQRHALINNLKPCNKISVYDMNDNFIKSFPSLIFAMEYFNIKHHSLVQLALDGEYKQAYGYKWKYSN